MERERERGEIAEEKNEPCVIERKRKEERKEKAKRESLR